MILTHTVTPMMSKTPIEECEHPDRRIETMEVTSFATPDIDTSYDRKVYVCNICDELIEDEDPELDEYEAQNDV